MGYTMKTIVRVAIICLLSQSIAFAQRDPPLLECYLPVIIATHLDGNKIGIDLVLKKETGPTEHREHQIYLLGYLLEKEGEVLKICAEDELLNKRKGGESKLFLDVLLEKQLVVSIDTKIAPRSGFAGQDVKGNYADGTKVGREKTDFLRINTFEYSFSIPYDQLYEKVSSLKDFGSKKTRWGMYESKFKILAFVPVNDCKYAKDVRDGVRGENDVGRHGNPLTPILYCRPLPYEFQIDAGTTVYIN
jgi:hypothetical protein